MSSRGPPSLPLLLALLLLLLMQVDLINSFQQEHEDLTNQMQGDSHRPLRRSKRRWVVTTLELEEEDPGPFPKFVGELLNNMSDNTSLIYLISGPGVDEYPEIGLFSIEDHQNGKIYVHRPVDRETTPSFTVHFDVVNRLTGEIMDNSLIFNIKISDVNDHAPQFTEKEFNVSVRASHEAGQPIFQMSTVDLDQENTPNSRVLYSLVSQTPLLKESGFKIDRDSGEIWLSGCPEYETAPQFTLLIRARDCGDPPLSATATVHVHVQEGNHHRPTFTQDNYQVQVPEGRVRPDVLRLSVRDGDSPFTSAWKAKFNISDGNQEGHFDILTDPETNEGILNVIKALDYEAHPTWSLIVAVDNEEPLSPCARRTLQEPTGAAASVTVSLQVTDANEPPAFHPGSFVVTEAEGARPGTPLGRFSATDPDRTGGQIRYELVHDPASWVAVDERSGAVVTRQQIDRESPYVNDSFYVIIAHAVDDGWSVELLMLRSLPPGDYSVPLVIGDRQGLSQKQSVHVRVCSCPGGSTCAAEQSAAGLELPALLFTVFTALAAALLLLLYRTCASAARRHRRPYQRDEGQQTLIKYNNESRAHEAQMGSEVRDQMPALQIDAAEEGAKLGAKVSQDTMGPRRAQGVRAGVMAETLHQKLCILDPLAEDPGSLPHIYVEEGAWDQAETLSSLSFSEHSLPSDLMLWLGAKA
ncbi:cadherin-like protein 26 isoform 3-T3 [Molossus nigricans]